MMMMLICDRGDILRDIIKVFDMTMITSDDDDDDDIHLKAQV